MVSFTTLCGLLIPSLIPRLATAAPTQDVKPRVAGTCNTATDRACWTTGYDINTDYQTQTPPGVIQEYWFDITEHNNWYDPRVSLAIR
jgi:hypothetical protein